MDCSRTRPATLEENRHRWMKVRVRGPLALARPFIQALQTRSQLTGGVEWRPKAFRWNEMFFCMAFRCLANAHFSLDCCEKKRERRERRWEHSPLLLLLLVLPLLNSLDSMSCSLSVALPFILFVDDHGSHWRRSWRHFGATDRLIITMTSPTLSSPTVSMECTGKIKQTIEERKVNSL